MQAEFLPHQYPALTAASVQQWQIDVIISLFVYVWCLIPRDFEHSCPQRFPLCSSAGISWSPASRGSGPNLPRDALGLSAGRGRPHRGAHADVHQQRGQRRHRHALPAEPVPAADPRRLLLHREHGPVRGVQEAAHAQTEPGQGGGRLLHPARPRLRDPQAHAGRRLLQSDRAHRPGGRAGLRRQRRFRPSASATLRFKQCFYCRWIWRTFAMFASRQLRFVFLLIKIWWLHLFLHE